MPNVLLFLIFDCLIAVSAAFLAWFGAFLAARDRTIVDVLRDGQLFLYSSALSAAAMGDLAKYMSAPPALPAGAVPPFAAWEPLAYFGGLVLILLFCAVLYGIALTNDVSLRVGADVTTAEVSTNRVAGMSVSLAVVATVYVGYVRSHLNLW